MITYYNIAGIKVRYNSEEESAYEASRFYEVPQFDPDEIDLSILENRYGRLLIPGEFTKTYEQEDDLNCFVSPSGEIIIQMGLNRIDERRDGSYRARISADMASAEYDFSVYKSYDGICGTLGRFIFECHVMNRGWLPMHAVSLGTDNGVILFSGVSGAGKTTQAELWMKHTEARIINGDRALLIPDGDGYITRGSAWSGSSEIYTNLCGKVRAIVFLEQAKENSIRRLSVQDAFSNIVKHCAMPYYHRGLMDKALNTIESATATIPMYYLKNKADEECYRITRAALFEG